jgi:hypothetical protein
MCKVQKEAINEGVSAGKDNTESNKRKATGMIRTCSSNVRSPITAPRIGMEQGAGEGAAHDEAGVGGIMELMT